jgi:hypothetical protein
VRFWRATLAGDDDGRRCMEHGIVGNVYDRFWGDAWRQHLSFCEKALGLCQPFFDLGRHAANPSS